MILHLSNTPLVNAPGNLSHTFNNFFEMESKWFYEQNYPNPVITPYGSTKIFDECRLPEALFQAKYVIVHNFLSEASEQIIRDSTSKAQFYRHIHSPKREGPIFRREINNTSRENMKCSVVCQYQQTLWSDLRPLPNIVTLTPTYIPQNNFHGVISSPTHKRMGRYNAKSNQEYLKNIDTFKQDFPGQYYETSSIPLENLHKLRCGFSVLIDEVITGGFHLSSIEGLSSGNIVINGAKDFVIDSFMSCLDIASRPPFIRSSAETIKDDLAEIALNYEKFADLRKESKLYFEKFLSPRHMVKHWSDHLGILTCP